jgi:hypothetical protein
MKCSHPESKYAIVNGNRVSIQDYDKGEMPYCEKGHELVGAQGQHNIWHFRHKHPSDVRGELSEWHKEWQREFDTTEVCFDKREGQIKARRADIVEGEYVVEIQHSSITKEEVDSRNKDYSLNKKKVIWVIDGSSMTVNGNVLTLDHEWKYSSFIDCDPIFVNVEDMVYKIIPQSIKSMTLHVNPIHKLEFIHSIKTDTVDKWEVPCQSRLFVKQQGAGNGKTWGIIQMLGRDDFRHYKHFIYVTKQHSARVIIKEEFRNQQTTLGFTDISEIEESNKKFLIHYTNSNGKDCTVIIATIDSFMYSVGDKHVKSFDKFQGITQSIVEGHLEVKDKRGTIQYAKVNPKLNAETLYIIDEAQDLTCCYAKAVLEVMKKTNMDVYVVGDKLQSISNELNSFAEFQSSPLVTLEEPVNICRRFIDPELIDFVNHMVPFNKYNLHPVSPYKITETTKSVFPILAKNRNDPDYIRDTVDRIMFEYNKQVETNKYTPEHFLIVVPFVSTNPLANILDVAINHYWKEKLTKEYISTLTDNYWKKHKTHEYYRYSIFHKSEQGTSINLDESARSTRIVSIHASKGDGREVVFVVGIDEYALKVYSGIQESLIYDSLLHVAITRMKQTLYFFYGEDEIGRKVKEWLHTRGEVFSIKNVHIHNCIKVKDILGIKGEALNNLNDLEYTEPTGSSELIDMGHHNIRYGILMEKIADLVRDEMYDKRQQAVRQNIACKTPVVKCCNWKEYNRRLKWNEGKGDYNPIDLTIPLLYNDTYKEYYDKIVKIIEQIKYNCNLNNELCPLELIVFYYMKQITQKHFFTHITVLELYNIVHIYEKSYQHPLRSHQFCLCKKMFRDNENGNSLTDYLVSHYEHMLNINSLIGTILQTHPNMSWNDAKTLQYKDADEKSRFVIKSECPFIGYNKTDVVILYVKPVLNVLNFNEIKTKSILDTFLIQNQIKSEKNNNYENYNNKQINMYIVATNLTEPYQIPLSQVDPRNIIADAMYDKFSLYNTELYYFYLQYRKNMDYKTFLIQWDKIKTETKSDCPRYVDDFMISMNRDSKRGKIKDLDPIFVSELNFALKDSIEDFLGL